MSEYVIEVLKSDLERPTIDEWLDEVKRLPRVELPPGAAAEAVREAREERERELNERIARLDTRARK